MTDGVGGHLADRQHQVERPVFGQPGLLGVAIDHGADRGQVGGVGVGHITQPVSGTKPRFVGRSLVFCGLGLPGGHRQQRYTGVPCGPPRRS